MNYPLYNPVTGETSLAGIYTGGDAQKVDSVIAAIAAGKKVACSIDRLLSGAAATIKEEPEYPLQVKETVLQRKGYFSDDPPIDLYTADGQERRQNFACHIRTLSMEEAVREASRCLNCGCGEGCGLCATICSEFAIHRKQSDQWEINQDECAACGMCYNRCPNNNIQMISTGIQVK